MRAGELFRKAVPNHACSSGFSDVLLGPGLVCCRLAVRTALHLSGEGIVFALRSCLALEDLLTLARGRESLSSEFI